MKIRIASEQDIPVICDLAERIWWPTYRGILSDGQISFMLEQMYSRLAVKDQMQSGMVFLLVKDQEADIGFAGYSLHPDDSKLRIHKLYLLPSQQGKGNGRALIAYLSDIAKQHGICKLELNVNRNNPALQFYQNMGFSVRESVDIPYFQFVMNDFVMEKMV